MFSLKLYTTDPAANTPAKIEEVLATVDFERNLEVSRTIGPANWFTLNKRMFAGDEAIGFPPEDIERKHYASTKKIAALSRKHSVLNVNYRGVESVRLSVLHTALQKDVPPEARGFYLSSAFFSFGPSDIILPTDDAEGQCDVELLAVAQLIFSLSCDRYSGQCAIFEQAVPTLPQFAQLQTDLERIVGPLQLHFFS